MKTYNTLRLIALSLAMFFILSPTSEGQILKQLGNSVKRKLIKKAEDKVVETLAEEIARRAFRPINDVMDDWIRENMKQDSSYAGLSDDSLAIVMRTNYGKILGSLNKAADLPPSYSFDYVMDIIVTDDGDAHPMKWYILENGDAMAFEQNDGKENQLMLMDIKKDIIVIYNMDQKTGQALPGMMSMGAAFAASAMEENAQDLSTIVKKSGSKKVAGYTCEEYYFEDDEYETQTWVSDDVPFDWKSSFGTLVSRVSPKLMESNSSITDGMMLESTSKEKGKRKGKYKSVSTWETKRISKDSFTINNSEYQFGLEMQ